MAGQAESAPTSSLDDVAEFLYDNGTADAPIEDRENPQTATGPGDDPDNSEGGDDSLEGDAPGEQADPDDEADGDDADGDEHASPTSGQKFEVSVVGADGAEVTKHVTIEELKSSYMMRDDYTRKTMELGERERQATEVVTTRLNEGRNYYLQEAAKVHQAIVTLAAIRPDNEMAVLAQTDPATYVAERARVEAVHGVLNQIEQGMRAHASQIQAETLEAQKRAYHAAWGELGKQGIDRQKLIQIFMGVHSVYGVPKGRLEQVSDPKLVQIMADAMQWRALKDKSAKLKPVVASAPPMPKQRQPVPQQTRANKRLDQRFKSGRANVKDLGAFLLANGG